MPVIVTTALVASAAIVTVDGTVTAVVLLEFRLMTRLPTGASPPVKFKVNVPDTPVPTFKVAGENDIVGAVTVTVFEPDVQSVAEAVMVTEPMLCP